MQNQMRHTPVNFQNEELLKLLKLWESSYTFKTHEGQIKTVEFSKEYQANKKISVDAFAIRISTTYSYLSIEKSESNSIIIKATVKPSSSQEFEVFCRKLKEYEALLKEA